MQAPPAAADREGLRVRVVPGEELGPLVALEGSSVLGVVSFGVGSGAVEEGGGVPGGTVGRGRVCPVSVCPMSVCSVRVPLSPLAGEPLAEVWLGSGEVHRGRAGRVGWAADGACLFGHLSAAEGGSPALEAAAFEAYSRLLRLLEAEGYPHLLRVWAAVPRINEPEGGEERYKAFSRGRARAFEAHLGPGFEARLSASTGVGSCSGPLVLHFLAGREPGTHVENPRQVSAYHYPPQYGPRSPSFARATMLPAALGGQLLISGTASIVGHESRHLGDISGQLDETLHNLERLLERPPAPRRFVPALLKVYLRRPRDVAFVQRRVEAWLPRPVPILYLGADICRAELEVEIEAVAEAWV